MKSCCGNVKSISGETIHKSLLESFHEMQKNKSEKRIDLWAVLIGKFFLLYDLGIISLSELGDLERAVSFGSGFERTINNIFINKGHNFDIDI